MSSVHHGKAAKWIFSEPEGLFKFHKFSKSDFCCFDLDKSFSVGGNGDILFGMNDHFKTRILVEQVEEDLDPVELVGHSDIITALMFDQKQRKLYSAGKDHSLVKWDVAGAELLLRDQSASDRTFKESSQIKKLHEEDIFTLEPIGDFKFILSGSKDKSVKLVETESMVIIASIEAGLPIYGIVALENNSYYFGKNSKKIYNWNLMKYFEEKDEISESPLRNSKKLSKNLSFNVKSCVVRDGHMKIDRFFNKSTSLTQSK